MNIHALRLLPSQDLKQQLQSYVEEKAISAAWMMTCVGSLTQYHLRLANQQGGTWGQGHFEIVSLVGTLSPQGAHLHLCVSDEQGRCTGGHLLDRNLIYTTAEIVIGEAPHLSFTREVDSRTGWRELHIKPR